MSAPVSFRNSAIQQWVYQEPKKNPKNGLNVYLNSSAADTSNPRIQLAKGRAPFGLQDGMEATARKNLEVNVECEDLTAFLENINMQNIDWITENCPKLFKRELERSVVSTLYRSLMAMPTNPSYKPLLRIKINTSGREPTRVFIVEKDATDTEPMEFSQGKIEDLVPGCTVLPIVEVGGLWFVSKGCGMTFVATDILVWPRHERPDWAFVGFRGVRTEPLPSCAPEPDATVITGGAATDTASAFGLDLGASEVSGHGSDVTAGAAAVDNDNMMLES